ncbi:hypothetical protein SK128_014726, partial [Halocaridina rubra]
GGQTSLIWCRTQVRINRASGVKPLPDVCREIIKASCQVVRDPDKQRLPLVLVRMVPMDIGLLLGRGGE